MSTPNVFHELDGTSTDHSQVAGEQSGITQVDEDPPGRVILGWKELKQAWSEFRASAD
jgi:hypothetical protein